MFWNRKTTYNLLNDPLAERIRLRTERYHKANKRKRAFWEGAKISSNAVGGLWIGAVAVGLIQILFTVVDTVIRETCRTVYRKFRPPKSKKIRQRKYHIQANSLYHDI